MSDPKTAPTSQVTVGDVFSAAAGTALFFVPGLCALLLLCALFGCLPLNLAPGLVGLAVACLFLAAAEMPSVKDRWRQVFRRFAKVGVAISLAVLAGAGGWNAYQTAISIPNITVDTNLYLPFVRDSRIARLEGDASLRFSLQDDLPVLGGSNALFPLYSAMVNATYPPNIPALNYPGGPFTTHGWYGYLGTEEVDILFGTAPGKGQDGAYYPKDSDALTEPERILLGGEGLVFFTSAANPVDGLTRDQLRGIYAGTIANWAEVGGEDLPILPYQHHENSDLQAGLERFMGDVPLTAPLTEIRRRMGGTEEYLADYCNTPGAIGFSYYIYASQLQANHNIKLLAVDGVYPSQETIGRGDYPITDSFYMAVRPGERTEEMDWFIAWALGEEGQALVARSGYAPIIPTKTH